MNFKIEQRLLEMKRSEDQKLVRLAHKINSDPTLKFIDDCHRRGEFGLSFVGFEVTEFEGLALKWGVEVSSWRRFCPVFYQEIKLVDPDLTIMVEEYISSKFTDTPFEGAQSPRFIISMEYDVSN
jgi:hypothetical protein